MKDNSLEQMPRVITWSIVQKLSHAARSLLIGLLLWTSVPDIAFGQECFGTTPVNQADSLALVALYNATNGPKWDVGLDPVFNDPWLQGPVFRWKGPILESCRVVELFLSGKMEGILPNALGDLGALVHLGITQNNAATGGGDLHGSIPAVLGSLEKLQSLQLSFNNLSGEIPSTLGELTNLTSLDLQNNQLTGSIPAELGKLMNLTSLSLGFNKLTGAVPTSFADLANLRSLVLQENQLHVLPDLTNMSALTFLNVRNNRFTFEDLEKNADLFGRATVIYSPQAEVETDIRRVGNDAVLSVDVGGQHSVYQWFKDGQAIAGATNPAYTVANAGLNDPGEYHCQVTNTVVPGLTIFSKKVTLQQAAFVVNSEGDAADLMPEDGICNTGNTVIRLGGPEPECTLRAAIETVNGRPRDDDNDEFHTMAEPVPAATTNSTTATARPVVFDIPGDGIPVITSAGLPVIEQPIIIDGSTQPAGRVRLAGSGFTLGLLLAANGSTIKGLLIDGYISEIQNSLSAIIIAGDANTVEETIVLNNRRGISIWGDNNIIRNNVVAGNPKGIVIEKRRIAGVDAIGNVVEDNLIGTQADGRTPLGNGVGVVLEGGLHNIIRNNLISGNEESGISIGGSGSLTDQNVIEGNKIGTDIDGSAALPNGQHGIVFARNAALNKILGNVISGNGNSGVYIFGDEVETAPNGNRIEFNNIGTNRDGTGPLGNDGFGVFIQGAIKNVVSKNVISANGQGGVVIELNAQETVVDQNKIGTDVFGRDILGVMGNKGTGVEVSGADEVTVTSNHIAYNNGAGIVIQATVGLISKNLIERNVGAGVEIDDADFKQILLTLNTVRNNLGGATGIHLRNSRAVIFGNLITGDVGDGLAFEQGSEAVVSKNNIFGNQGLGINNLDPSVSIDAQGNWWGDASGPGPGSGDEVSTGVDFANWLAQPVAVVAAAESDTVTLATGITDTVSLFLQNWQQPDDVLDVTLSDDRGWLQQPGTFSVTLSDSLGAEAKLAFIIPAGTADGNADHIQVIATSQTDPTAADTTTFAVVSQNAVLARMFVTPDSVTLAPGDSAQFNAEGVDQFGRDFTFTPQWSATGGSIDANGLYIAGNENGTFLVTATDANAQITAQGVVVIDATVLAEDAASTIPTEFRLYQNYPNPFNPETRIQYDLPKTAHVRIRIFNILGQKIRTLVEDQKPAGSHSVVWDGLSDNGRVAATGVYIYRMRTSEFVTSRKLLLLR